ncbi:MAG: TolC family protein [Acidobacteriota bacterium]|nr:TolC family protein [Acidobacteriota bacterium]
MAAVSAFGQTLPTPAPQLPQPASPMSLSTALSTAMQQVSTLRQAEIDEQIAEEDLRQARAALLPRARDSFTITYNSRSRGTPDPSFIAANAVHEYQNLLGVTGDLNLGLVAAVRRSRALLDAARAGTDIARRALVRGVNEAYYGAALASAKRSAAEQSLAAAEEFERVTDLNYRAGEVPEVDAIRARLQTAARRDDLAQARQAEVIANASLGTLLGSGITNAPSIEPLPQAINSREIETLTAANVGRRPEFVQLDAQVRAAEANIRVSRGEMLPRITYSVDTGFDSNTLTPGILSQHRGILATANVDIPIFDWGASFSRIRQANLRARGARIQRELTIRDLYLQYATARQEALTAAERVDNARRAVADAERNVEISIARYRAGEATIVEATDALTTLATQRLALQQALFDYQTARAHLLEAVGQ